MGQALRSLGSSVGTVIDSIAPGLALAEGAVVSSLFQDAAPTRGPNILYLPAPDPLSEFHHEPQELAWRSWGIALINGVMSTGLLSGHWEVGLLPNMLFPPTPAASSLETSLGNFSSRPQFPKPQSFSGCIPSF